MLEKFIIINAYLFGVVGAILLIGMTVVSLYAAPWWISLLYLWADSVIVAMVAYAIRESRA